jgi:hypothetical protein
MKKKKEKRKKKMWVDDDVKERMESEMYGKGE